MILPKLFRRHTSILAYGEQLTSCRKLFSSTGSTSEETRKRFPTTGETEMRAWELHSYDAELQLSTCRKIPTFRAPFDVLVKVHAASLNPIDIAMTKGYGADTLNVLRSLCDVTELKQLPLFRSQALIEFPLTLGRDFSGTIVEMGHGAKEKYDLNVGDKIYGVTGVQRQGSHAEYVLTSIDTIRRKPENLSFIEAASIPYVSLTSWSALRVTGAYCNLAGKRFLVLGGSGGVGTFAVQYLKAMGAHVVTSCSSDASDLMASLGCDFVIDYKSSDFVSMVKLHAPYDCVLDLSGPANAKKASEQTLPYLRPGSGQFITLSPPFLSNMDKFGLIGGSIKNVGDILSSNIKSWGNSQAITKWAFFVPNGQALDTFRKLLEEQRIRPVIHQVFKFSQLSSAFKRMEEGHARGKVVIDLEE